MNVTTCNVDCFDLTDMISAVSARQYASGFKTNHTVLLKLVPVGPKLGRLVLAIVEFL